MPSKKSRRVRDHKTEINKPIRSLARSRIATAREAIKDDPNSEETAAVVNSAVRSLSKAAQNGVVHRNNASRRISRLMKSHARAKSE
ncbi:MAG: 30S ribosomal protein S20 [Chloroflexi bacterium]|nr:30S ribosomal protein S20 [Chloroflexota bacterium]